MGISSTYYYLERDGSVKKKLYLRIAFLLSLDNDVIRRSMVSHHAWVNIYAG